MFPHTITIFNKWFNKETKKDEYHRTIIRNVAWNELKNVNIITAGYETADDYVVIIPMNSAKGKYLKPKEYQKLSKQDSIKFFTLQPGDIIVKGEINKNYTSVNDLKIDYDSVMTITRVNDNSDNAINYYLNNWEVGGK